MTDIFIVENGKLKPELHTNVLWYPEKFTFWHHEAKVISGGGMSVTLRTQQEYLHYAYVNPSVNGNEFHQTFALDSGTYTFSVLCRTSPVGGKLDWYVDTTQIISQQNLYTLVTTYNMVLSTTSISITGGFHTLKGIINNPGGPYEATLTKYWFEKTG